MQVSSWTELTWMPNVHNSTAETPCMMGPCNGTSSPETSTPQFSLGVLVLLALLMVLLALVTILGNVLVILAFILDRNLRHRSNYFFLNLAISDFAVGVFCMPLYIPYALTGTWHLGRGLCKLWLLMDYLVCSASVFNIVLISYDRFLSVTKAVSYRAQQGMMSNPVVKMVAIWVFAFLLYSPAVLLWEYVSGCSMVEEGQCYAEFFNNWYFLLCASTLEFFVPLISVTYFNVSIFHNIQRRQRRGSIQHCESPGSSNVSWRSCFMLRQGPSLSDTEDSVSSAMRSPRPSLVSDCTSPTTTGPVAVKRDFSASFRANSQSRLQRDKKIAKSLAIIVCIFAICWAPYTLLMIIRGACQGTCVHPILYEITFWLLWINSSLNPFLYPLCHMRFQMAFMKILCPKKLATLRSNYTPSV
ncbi:histamine H3 receptor-like [Numida meleagris]|uniref:histamine H3 receptor-like n=1 Tax=Numida meleagris TaxID=8996 RepID=UPI000B3DCF64|nr:histamine H3 receptor-like [Numida meleagris]XP_021244297.1 histamine H3 receptor-like [Numida meleagris]XP_021244298.1 histamine H3 receptor-like [Numida meleagris]XP_021244299.1 histamine H3 receptor-like [Numida meleagris]XP_021244300.1 histamine H3 receptor-like [Numida meleagris]XP_021244301.1 histamine H3 receptor-like [Numida meleagris]XP_021244302.1 histamine H3 receptor-like [Numida meleagris]